MDREAFMSALTPAKRRTVVLPGPGPFRFQIDSTIFEFHWDDPGICVSCEGNMPEAIRSEILLEILAQVTSATGEAGRLMEDWHTVER